MINNFQNNLYLFKFNFPQYIEENKIINTTPIKIDDVDISSENKKLDIFNMSELLFVVVLNIQSYEQRIYFSPLSTERDENQNWIYFIVE